MTLGDIIKRYTREHNMSVRSFSQRTGLSGTYLGYLIKGQTPSGEVPSPTIDTYRVCAKAMNISVDELVRMTEGDLSAGYVPEYSDATRQLFNVLRGASEEEIMTAVKILKALRQ